MVLKKPLCRARIKIQRAVCPYYRVGRKYANAFPAVKEDERLGSQLQHLFTLAFQVLYVANITLSDQLGLRQKPLCDTVFWKIDVQHAHEVCAVLELLRAAPPV